MRVVTTMDQGTTREDQGEPRHTTCGDQGGPRNTRPEDQGTHALKEHIGELVGRKQTHTPRYEFTSYLFVSRQMELRGKTLIIQSPCA